MLEPVLANSSAWLWPLALAFGVVARFGRRLATPRVLWGAIFASTILFLGIAIVLGSQGVVQVRPEAALLPAVVLVAIITAVGSVVLPPRIARAGLKRLALPVREIPSQERILRERGRRNRVFENPNDAVARSLPVLQTAMIIGVALCESVALLGFVLLLLGFQLAQAIGLFVLSWVLLATKYPTDQGFSRQLETAYDADLEPLSPDATK